MVELIGFIFIVIFGTLAHFFYDWSNHNKIVGLFCAVNESTWEHIKIALCPSFMWLIIEIPFLINNPNFLFAKCISLLSIIIIIPLFFYAYRTLLKKDILALDIIDFTFAIAIGQFLSYLIIISNPVNAVITIISSIFIIVIFIIYVLFTYFAPKNFLFKDPINKKYGFSAHIHKKNIR